MNMSSVSASYNKAKPTVIPFPTIGFDPDFTTPSSGIEFHFNEGLFAPAHFIVPQKKRSQRLFEDLTSNIVNDIQLIFKYEQQQPSIGGIAEGSSEDFFVKRNNLFEVVQLAQDLIESIFSYSPQLSYEYCCVPEDDNFEWLDVNLHYHASDDTEIEALLDQLDHLNDEFSERLSPAKELLINFHLDIV